MGKYILGVSVGQTSTQMSMFDRPSGFAGFRWRFIPAEQLRCPSNP